MSKVSQMSGLEQSTKFCFEEISPRMPDCSDKHFYSPCKSLSLLMNVIDLFGKTHASCSFFRIAALIITIIRSGGVVHGASARTICVLRIAHMLCAVKWQIFFSHQSFLTIALVSSAASSSGFSAARPPCPIFSNTLKTVCGRFCLI